jgi:phytoene desaturase
VKTTQSVAIIGGGLAGLCAAGLLSKQGHRVRLFEANAKLGGFCAATTLSGYTFNDGALYLALPGILEHVFERLGLDRVSLLPLRRITAAQTITLPDGTVVSIAAGPRVTIERPAGAVDSARLEAELDALLRKWTPVLRLFADDITVHPLSLPRLLLRGWRELPKLRGTVAAELSRAIHDPAARAALSGVLLFTGLPPQQTPVSSFLGLVSLLTEGFYLPEGGMGRIPDALSQAVTRYGGDVALNARVNRIIVTGGCVRGLNVEGHGVIEADTVISTASGMATFASLLSPADVPATVRRKIEAGPLSHKGLLLQLGLANRIDAPSHSMSVLPYMEEQGRIFVPAQNDVPWPIYSVPTVTMPEFWRRRAAASSRCSRRSTRPCRPTHGLWR